MKLCKGLFLLTLLGFVFASCQKEEVANTALEKEIPKDSLQGPTLPEYYIQINDTNIVEVTNTTCYSYGAEKQQGGCQHEVVEITAHGYTVVFKSYIGTHYDFEVADIALDFTTCDPSNVYTPKVKMELLVHNNSTTYRSREGRIKFDYGQDTTKLEFSNMLLSMGSGSIRANGRIFCTR